jgi:predicted dienelactone hydrolase
LVFSHGFGGTRLQSIYLTEHLASHGFVVAAPDHVGNTFAELVNQAEALPALESARLRPSDVARTIDLLLARSRAWPTDPLAFAADPARVAVAGHSFGGFTTLRVAGATIDVAAAGALCATDPSQFFCDGWPGEVPFPASARDARVLAALGQAPGGSAIFGPAGLGEVDVPTMIQAGTADQTTPFATEAEAPFAALPAPSYLLSIAGAGHFTFSDMCGLVAEIGLSVAEFDDGCGPDNVPAAKAHAVINRYAVAFLRRHLDGSEVDAALFADDALPPAGADLQIK